MERNEYQKAFDALSFSGGFQERTAGLLRQRAGELEKERSNMTFGKSKKISILIAACIALLAVSVSAAYVWLTPAQVAQEHGQPLLAEAFEGPGAIEIDETVESGDFSITLLGLVTGRNLDTLNPDLEKDHTYSVLALRRLDGEPLENETFDFSRYTMTPLAAGCSPAAVNNWTLDAGASGLARDGVYYYLLDTRSIEMFADRTVYMAFYEGGAPNNTIFTVAEDGTIAFAEDFTGAHALFTLPLDPAKADPAAVAAFLEEHDIGWSNERTPDKGLGTIVDETSGGMMVTVVPTIPQEGAPYSAEDFARDLAQRQESFQKMVSTGNMSQADYDAWNQRQEEILAGLRDGSMTAVMDEEGVIYFSDVQQDGISPAPGGREAEPADAETFAAFVEEQKAELKQQLEAGSLSQASYDQSLRELEEALAGVRDGTLSAVLLGGGSYSVGTPPKDGLRYQVTQDGVTAVIG